MNKRKCGGGEEEEEEELFSMHIVLHDTRAGDGTWMLKHREDRQNDRERESDEVREEGRDEGNVEGVVDVGEDRGLMNPPIF